MPGVEPGQLVVLQHNTVAQTVLTSEDDRLLRLPDGGVDLVVGKIALLHRSTRGESLAKRGTVLAARDSSATASPL